MIYLLLSILSSAALMVVFKLYDRFKVNTSDAIVINYLVAASLSFILDPTGLAKNGASSQPWFYHAMVMGILFISLFNVIGISTQKIGVSVTSVANKMSLIMPVLFAIFFLNDSVNAVKIVGIIIALLAVYFTTRSDKRSDIDKRYALFPLIVFIGSGFIDTFFKYNEEYTLGENGLEPFLAWIFLTASIIGVVILIINYIRHKKLPALNAYIGGLFLGIPNYFSVFFLVKSLSIPSIESSVVFPVNNMSIVAVSALAGIFFFREKVSRINIIGIVLCMLAIACIAFSEDILPILGIE
jgi:drug/metabolite transporter (DMT)-like permease